MEKGILLRPNIGIDRDKNPHEKRADNHSLVEMRL